MSSKMILSNFRHHMIFIIILATGVSSDFRSSKLVPNIVKTIPKNILTVQYYKRYLEPGTELTPTAVQDAPTVTWDAHASSFYTLIMIDPDAGVNAEALHWIVGNIPGNNINKGETLTEYVGAGAPKGDGFHRYVFFLFKQSKKLDFSNEKRVDIYCFSGRLKFSIKNFIRKYHLGPPIAGNFFQAQYDAYVDKLMTQFTT